MALRFFTESVKNLKTVGTLTRSSKYAIRKMLHFVDFENSKVLVELGAGDGVITRHILEKMGPDSILLSFEINPSFVDELKKIEDPRLVVVQDSAENLREHLQNHGIDSIDAIISALPLVAFKKDLASSIVNKCKELLKEGAPYIQIHYSLVLKKLYEGIFGNVKSNFVLLNVPPAFIMVSLNA